MRIKLFFLTKVLVLAALLFPLREPLLPAWRWLLHAICRLFVGGPGVTLYLDSLDKAIPFTALVLATPGIPLLRRSAMLLAGILCFAASDVASYSFSVAQNYSVTGLYNTPPHPVYFWVWRTYGRWLWPVLLWLLLTRPYLGDLLRRADPPTGEPAL